MIEFLHILQNIRCGALNIFFQLCTYLSQEVIVFAIAGWILWCKDKKFGYRIVFSYFLSCIPVQILKLVFRIDRPWIIDPTLKPVDSAVKAATGYSFPSGHTQCAVSAYGSIALFLRKKWITVISVTAIVLVGFSRMYLGCHTPADVLTSAAVSLIVIFSVDFVMRHITFSPLMDWCFMIIGELVCVGMILYFNSLIASGLTTPELAADGYKIAGGSMAFFAGWLIDKHYINFRPETGTLSQKLIRIAVGGAVLLLVMTVGKKLLGNTISGNFIRYFIISAWIFAIYPLIVKTVRKDDYSETEAAS